MVNAHSYSPSAGKPKLVVESWQSLGIPINIREPIPATVDELGLAHSGIYVEKALTCRTDNGFGNRLPEVAASLSHTIGAFVCAAREALGNGQVAVAQVSGFHPASHDLASGFCTSNGLVVVAQVLRNAGLVSKAGILDFDQHYGDGTVDIIRVCELGGWLSQYSAATPNIEGLIRLKHFCNAFLTWSAGSPTVTSFSNRPVLTRIWLIRLADG